MKLYYLKRDAEVMGTVPQDSKVIGFYDFNHPRSVYNVAYLTEADRVIFPEGLHLKPSAKFTDLAIVSFPLVFNSFLMPMP